MWTVWYLQSANNEVEHEGNDGEEVDEIHGLLEEGPLLGRADKPHHVLDDEEKDGDVLWNTGR